MRALITTLKVIGIIWLVFNFIEAFTTLSVYIITFLVIYGYIRGIQKFGI